MAQRAQEAPCLHDLHVVVDMERDCAAVGTNLHASVHCSMHGIITTLSCIPIIKI